MSNESSGVIRKKKSTSKKVKNSESLNSGSSSSVPSTSTHQNEESINSNQNNSSISTKEYKPHDLTCKFMMNDENGNKKYCEATTIRKNRNKNFVAEALCVDHTKNSTKWIRKENMKTDQLNAEAKIAFNDHIQYLIDNEVYFYVGKTRSFDVRRRRHKLSIEKLYKKFGMDVEVFERMQVLFVAMNETELEEMEKIMINMCINNNFCVNAKEGDETEGEKIRGISFIYVLSDKNKLVAQNNKVGEAILISKGFKKINENKIFTNFNINIDDKKKVVNIKYNLNGELYDYNFDINKNVSEIIEGIGKINLNVNESIEEK